MSAIITLILSVLSLLVLIGTVLPIWRTTRWWVRILDFPRFQLAVVALIIIILMIGTAWPLRITDATIIAAVALAAGWQVSWVWRYFPGAPLEVPASDPEGAQSSLCLTFLTSNVYQPCRDTEGLLKIIMDARPDVILAVETDEWWCSRLQESLGSRYPHNLMYPLSNGYGMALFSRHELVEPVVRFVVDDAIPSIKTGILLPAGVVIDLYGLHPQPPAPQQSSEERDTELVAIGREIGRSTRPAVVLGDLNDVAWSATTEKFKAAGNLRDPRRGRGFFNTYPAGTPGLRYPLDHIFHTRHFHVKAMSVFPRFQSDHLPVAATLCLANCPERKLDVTREQSNP